jgi:hypothetical protein
VAEKNRKRLHADAAVREEDVMFLIFLTFVLTTGLYGVLFWFAFRRVLAHLRENAAGRQAFIDHVLMPLFGKGPHSIKELGP